jgi:hypothetical protein
MRIPLDPPAIVTTDDGPVECVEGNVHVAVSTGVNIRVVPVGPDGTAYPMASISIVDRGRAADVQAFVAACNPPLVELVNGRRR